MNVENIIKFMPQETEIKVTYDCPAELVYKCLTDQMTMCQFT